MRQLEWSTINTTTPTTTTILTVNNMLKGSNSFISISNVLRYLKMIFSKKSIKHWGIRILESYQYPHGFPPN